METPGKNELRKQVSSFGPAVLGLCQIFQETAFIKRVEPSKLRTARVAWSRSWPVCFAGNVILGKEGLPDAELTLAVKLLFRKL